MITQYDILGIERDASQAQIVTAFRTLAMKHHPDKSSTGVELYLSIRAAYETLSDPIIRRRYDEALDIKQDPNMDLLTCMFIEMGSVHPSHFPRCYLNNIDWYKKQILDSLSPVGLFPNLGAQCRALKNILCTQGDLRQQITHMKEDFLWNVRADQLAVLSTWMIVNDDADLLDNINYLHFFDKSSPFSQSIAGGSPLALAAAFGSKTYIRKGFEQHLFTIPDIREGLSAAANLSDAQIFLFIAHLATYYGINISTINDLDHYNKKYDPLFWAIRLNNPDWRGLKLLLDHHVNVDAYTAHSLEKETYLHLCIVCCPLEIIKLILIRTNKLMHKDIFGKTALDLAIEQDNQEVIALIEEEIKARSSTPFDLGV